VIFVKNDKDYKRDGGSTYIPACGKYWKYVPIY